MDDKISLTHDFLPSTNVEETVRRLGFKVSPVDLVGMNPLDKYAVIVEPVSDQFEKINGKKRGKARYPWI